MRRMLALADLCGLVIAFVLAERVFDHHGAGVDRIDQPKELALFILTLPVWLVVARLHGLYDKDEERTDHTTADDIVGVFHLVTVGAWLFYAGSWLTDAARPPLGKLFLFWGLAIVVIPLGRSLARMFCRRRPSYRQNTVILGCGRIGQLIASKLLKHPEYGLELVGFVDDMPLERQDDVKHLNLLGPPERLPAIVRLFGVERVIVAFSRHPHESTLDLLRSMKDLDVQVDVVPRLFEIVGPRANIHTVEGLPLIGLPPPRLSRSSLLLKRALDVVGSGVGLLLLAPAFAAIAVLIRIDSTGPVFFRQVRMGFGGGTFRILKFRTMLADADERKPEVATLNQHAHEGGDPRMFKVPNDPRVTRVGAFLRRYSFDELPQLLNVLRGEMSLVGPRPLILDEDRHVRDWARRRLELKPGITGPWQVLGASDIPFDEMVRLDYHYATGWSVFNDLKLIARTEPALIRSRNAY